MRFVPPPSIALLKSALSYDPETGVFTWANPTGRRRRVGDIAGSTGRGHVSIQIGNGRWFAHRLAWLWVHGEWPDTGIGHINGDGCDNRIANLRKATPGQNLQNQWKAHRENETGALGVRKRFHRYHASITVEGRRLHIGAFRTVEQAANAYLQKKRELHPFGDVAKSA